MGQAPSVPKNQFGDEVIDQDELDASSYQDLLTKNDRKGMMALRDRTDPPISATNKQKAADAVKAFEKAAIDAYFRAEDMDKLKAYPTNEDGGLPLHPENQTYIAQKVKELDEILKNKAKPPPPPDPFGPNLTQKDIDLVEVNRLILANDLVGLKKMRDRTEPPLDPEVKAKILEAIDAINKAADAAGSAPDWEIGKPGGVKPKDLFKPPPIASQNLNGPAFIESFSGGGTVSGVMRAKAPKLPPKEEIIGEKVIVAKAQQPQQGLLTDEGWRQLKNLGINILKYTGMYVAPAVLAGVAYQYSKNQPDGTLLRSIVDIIPSPKYTPEQAREFQVTMGKVGNLFTEVIPDYIKGTTPGKPGGRIIEDVPGTLTGPTPGPFEGSLDVLKNIERVANWGVTERQQIADVFPRAPSVLSRSMSLDNFPTVEYQNTDVARYATQNNSSVSGDLVTVALRTLSNRISPSTTPRSLSAMSLSSGRSSAPAAALTQVTLDAIFPRKKGNRDLRIDTTAETLQRGSLADAYTNELGNLASSFASVVKRGAQSPMEPAGKRFAFGAKTVGGKKSRLG